MTSMRSTFAMPMMLAACFDPSDGDGAGGTEGTAGSTSASTSSSPSTSDDDGNETTSMGSLDASAETTAASSSVDTTSGSTQDSGSDGSSGASDMCGNGMLDAGELCDDGINAGLLDGDCASDCSTSVTTRTLVLGEEHLGSLESLPGAGDLPERVDSLCPNGYKALFAYGGARTASIAPFAGDGQVDWALRPWTRYELDDGTWIGTTDGAALLGVREGAWVGLENPIAAGSTLVWTGMWADYTSILEADEVCDGFSNAGFSAWTGDVVHTDLAAGVNFLQDSVQTCILPHPVLCADQ